MAGKKRYRCILADPPWPARDQGSRIAPACAGHYDVMTTAAIIGLGPMVTAWSHDAAHLWLCAPNYVVLDGTAALVCQQWGFRPVQMMTWVKGRIGMGHWLRNSTEQILLGLRGRLGPCARNVPTHVVAPRGVHSAKPDEMYDAIEAVSPGPRLELFARRARRGWRSWGNEAPEQTRLAEAL